MSSFPMKMSTCFPLLSGVEEARFKGGNGQFDGRVVGIATPGIGIGLAPRDMELRRRGRRRWSLRHDRGRGRRGWFGPETEVVLPRLESDIIDIFLSIVDGRKIDNIKWSSEQTLGIVLASKGYPMDYKKGFKIEGLSDVKSKVYHMGTKMENGEFYTNGGRVLFVVASGKDLREAKEKALADVKKIKCDNLFYRSDIGHRALNK